jgi:hypothetical protein
MTDDIDRELRLILDDFEPQFLPIVLGGGPVYRCSRCGSAFTAQTWHVSEDLGEQDGLRYQNDICRHCATADPKLSIWQAHCNVADQIDALMQAAPDKRTRLALAAQLKRAADHFAEWRWPEEADD